MAMDEIGECQDYKKSYTRVKWLAVPSNAFSNDTVTHLIVTKQALPAPQDIGEVIEVMRRRLRSMMIFMYSRTTWRA